MLPVLTVYRGPVLWILLLLRVLRHSSMYRVYFVTRVDGEPPVAATLWYVCCWVLTYVVGDVHARVS